MKNRKIVIATIVMIFMFAQFSVFIKKANAETTTGSYGSISWSYDSKTKIMTFSGSGEISMKNLLEWKRYDLTVEKIIINDGITSIRTNAFDHCTNLTSIEIPSSVTSIDSWAFYGCTSLTNIEVDNNNKQYCSVDGVLFNKSKDELIRCPGGKQGNYQIPDYVTTIGSHAFEGCTSLTSIEIPNSVTSINSDALDNCTSLTSIEVDNSNEQYCSVDGVLFNKSKDELIKCPGGKQGNYQIPDYVTTIGNHAFEDCTGLASIEIPSSVTTIGSHAFEGCTSLTSIEIPSSVTTIKAYAFYKSTSLTSIEIPSSVTTIEVYTFYNCTNLTSIEIPSSVTSIEYGAFDHCTNLTSIEIPSSVTSINSWAFDNCTSLTSIEVDNSNEQYCSVDGVLFNKSKDEIIRCPGGKRGNYRIPDYVTTIGNSAFEGCTGLASIEIPSSVTTINAYAFYKCTSLTSIEVDNSNEQYCSVDGVVFNKSKDEIIRCPGGKQGNYQIPDYVTKIGPAAFYGCANLTSIEIPSSVTTIGVAAFSNCRGLTSIKIPSSVTSIRESAFYYCTSLTSIEIPSSVTAIENSTFVNCTSLTSIEIPSSVTSIGDNVFHMIDNYTSLTIYCEPDSTAHQYAKENYIQFVFGHIPPTTSTPDSEGNKEQSNNDTEVNGNNDKSKTANDDTKSNKIIPQTGARCSIPIIVILAIIVYRNYKKSRKYNQ